MHRFGGMAWRSAPASDFGCVSCFCLVHWDELTPKCTKSNQKSSKDDRGSTKTGRRCAFYFVGRHHGVGHARWFCFSGAGHGPQKEPGQCAGQNPGGFFSVHRGLFHGRLQRGLWHHLFCGGRTAGRQERLRPGQVLLFADLCRRHSRHHFGRHCRAGQVLAAVDRHGRDRRFCLPLL